MYLHGSLMLQFRRTYWLCMLDAKVFTHRAKVWAEITSCDSGNGMLRVC